MFDTRQTKAEITAAASIQNERLVAAYLEIERLQAAKRRALAIADERAKEAVALRGALERLTKDPPATLAREPDTDAEVIIKMRAIARAALSGKDPA